MGRCACKTLNPEPHGLLPSDAPWDAHKSVSDDVGGIYLLAAEYERYGARMASCGGLLRFGGLPSKKLEKLALGYVRRISVVSGTVLSASGGDP